MAIPTSNQSLIRFEGIFGGGSGQIPPASTILSASLSVYVENATITRAPARVLQDWDVNQITWNNAKLGGNTQPGLQVDGVEATGPNDGLPSPSMTTFCSIDVTDVVAAWSGGAANYGILLSNQGANDNALIVTSSDGTTIAHRPALIVACVPEPALLTLSIGAGAMLLTRRRP